MVGTPEKTPPPSPERDAKAGGSGEPKRSPERRGRDERRGRRSRSESRPVIIHKTVRKIGGSTTYPMLTRTNYSDWAVMMQVMLQARGLWIAVESGTDDEADDRLALEALLHAVPPEMISTLGRKKTAKEAWDKLATMRVGSDRSRKAKAQQLRKEFENIAFRDGESVEDFTLRLSSLVSELAALGDDVDEQRAIEKLLRVVPAKFEQIALSIETLLDLTELSLEDVTGRLKAVEDRAAAAAAATGGKLLLTEEEWAARCKERRGGASSSGKGGGRGKAKQKRKGKAGPRANDKCHNCGKLGHWARDCKAPKKQDRGENQHALVAEQEDDEEPALLLTQVCALGVAVEEEGAEFVELDEVRAQVNLGSEDDDIDDTWYLDTGASSHMTGNKAAFSELDTAVKGAVKFGDGSVVGIEGRGTVVFRCQNGKHRALTDVYVIPRLRSNIVSLGQLDERGCQVLIEDGVLRIRDRDRKLLVKVRRGKSRLYTIKLEVTQPVCLAARKDDDAWLWHGRFGHIGFDALARLGRQGMVRGLPKIEHTGELCDSCLAGKQRRHSFPQKAKYRAEGLLDLVHGDLCGPITPATQGGRRYFLLLVDDCSRYMWLRLLSSKDEAPRAIMDFQARVEAETGRKLRVLRTDRGGEFTSVEFGRYCAEKGVERHLTAPYSPQQNGVVERRNQTVVGMARSMMKAKGVPAAFWGEAVSTAVFILNCAPTKSVAGKTPFEAWHGRKPDVSFLRTFGCVAHVKTVKSNLSKLEDRSTRMVFLGYEHGSKAYRLYDPVGKKLHISRDVIFDEAASWDWSAGNGAVEAGPSSRSSFRFEFVTHHEVTGPGAVDHAMQDEEEEPLSPAIGAGGEAAAESPVPEAGESPVPGATGPNSPQFVSPPPHPSPNLDAAYDGEPLRFRAIDGFVGGGQIPGEAARIVSDQQLMMVTTEEPNTFAAAERDPSWRKAMMEEMRSIEENNTWELVDPPAHCRPIGLKWVFKVKRDADGKLVKHKARLVAKGYVQREGIDFEEVFALVACMESVRLVLALAAKKGWRVHHMDVKSAFLNGELTEEVFVQQPPGFVVEHQERKVLRLRKALYGLRQAPRAWNIKLDASLKKLGFAKCANEHALYTRRSRHGPLIVGVYVDDLIITGAEQRDIDEFKGQMISMFRMSDLGLLCYYLGIEVEQGDGGIKLCQSAYARKLVEKGGLADCNPTQSPMEERIKLTKQSTAPAVDATRYRSIVGGLRYLVHTRPDIAFAVGYVSRFMEDPREDHLVAVKRILRYIAGTKEQGIMYKRNDDEALMLMGYSDSDMAGDIDGRKSTTGVLFSLGGSPISWQSQKQRVVALSTCEAEYIAAATAACQGVWLHRLLGELIGGELPAPKLMVDNKSAIALCKNPVLHDRSKHIEVRYHFIRDCVDGGQIVLEFVDTGNQLADILTKSLGRVRFKELCSKIGMTSVRKKVQQH